MKKVLYVATVDSHIKAFHIPYLKMLKENGYEVHVATNGDEKIDYCDVKHTICIERNPFKFGNIKAIRQLKNIVNKENFDIIHCHTPMGSVVTRLASKKTRKNGTRVFYTAHGFHFYKGAPLINWLLYYSIEKWLSKYTDTLITINKEDYNLAKRKFKNTNIEYIPGVGVNTDKFNISILDKEKNKLRTKLGLKKDDFVMIFPARLDKNKNQSFLIKAMEKLIRKHSNIHLLLPGNDELNGYYQALTKKLNLESNIHFLGYRTDIQELLRISNVSVSSSLREGLPVNLLEALSTQIPVVALKCRGMQDLIINNQNGFIVNNLDEFIDKILIIYKKKFVVNNQDDFINKFSIDNIVNIMKKRYFDKRLLFVHASEKVKVDEADCYYTDGSYNNDVWNRYLGICTKLSVIFRKENKVYKNKEAADKFHRLNDKINLILINNRTDSIRQFLSLKRYLDNKRIIKEAVLNNDLIIARVPCDESYLAIKYAKKYNKKCLVEVVGCPFDTLWNYNLKGKILAFSSYFRMKKTVKISDYAIYVTNMFLQKRYPNKGKFVGCSDVSLTDFDKDILKKRLEKIKVKGKKDNKIVISTVGTVGVKYKGQQDVIKAMSQIDLNGFDVEYWIIGTGNETYLRNVMKKYNVNNVKFLGFVNHDKIFDILDKTDIYIQPSYTEGLCRALVEALSRACPCIASSAGGNSELVNSDFVYHKGNVKDLTIKINKLLDIKMMEEQAKLNFDVSKNYQKELLDKKRKEFYCEFVNKEEGM